MKEIRGLSKEEVEQRIKAGQVNKNTLNHTKTYSQIIKDNVFTLFNFINLILAILVLTTGSLRNLLFLGVVVTNIIIGIFQECRAKKTLDKINLIVSSKVVVLRDNDFKEINIEEVVLDDVISLKTGNQIIADGEVIDGSIEVDESLLTGESDVIKKENGDELYSGSFVTSGSCLIKVNNVGDDNYAARITKDAKKYSRYPSELRDTLNKIIKYIGICIIPVGLALFAKQFYFEHQSYNEAILGVAAALIGMVPEGLVILTSIALAVSVINLAKHKTLVQELYCIETLARVDTLCLDKTGTITEGRMEVENYIGLELNDPSEIIGNMCSALVDDNPTIEAIRNGYKSIKTFETLNIIPFSSKRKYSGVNFKEGKYVFGAYEFIFKQQDEKIKKMIEVYASQGKRVICLASADEVSEREVVNPKLLGLLIIVDRIRDSAYETLAFFRKQGVDIKIISGDNPLTVSEVAKRAGVIDYDKYVDASTLSDEDIDEAVKKYTVFGRVTPNQKKLMVQALRKAGHSVGMSGDGVNDVLAFKEANVSIAMASGSEVAKNSANLVLLNSNFDALPHVLNEGRRVINNIQNVATLFLTKTIYSCILSILLIILPFKYPFLPIHLTFVSSLTIGIPSFFMALEPNHERVTKSFMNNVRKISLPAALALILSLNYLFIIGKSCGFSQTTISTLGVLALCFTGLIVLFKVSIPFTTLRKVIYISMLSLVIIGFVFFSKAIVVAPLSIEYNLVHIVIIFALIILSFWILNYYFEKKEK